MTKSTMLTYFYIIATFFCQTWCQSNELLESYINYFTPTPLKVTAPFGVDNCIGYFLRLYTILICFIVIVLAGWQLESG